MVCRKKEKSATGVRHRPRADPRERNCAACRKMGVIPSGARDP
ncbi:MAG: hypothetical protein OJF58_000268 [Enhydrobacter sp.]|nr:MAG: hypothetical protein OJF58_000268 [Enhydrobacter sp.]